MFRKPHGVGMVFITFIFFTLIYFRHPALLADMKERLNFTEVQMTNALMAADVALGFIFNVNMYRENKEERSRCRYSFYIQEEGFNFENYLGFPTDIDNTYIYNHKGRGNAADKNCISVIIPFKKDGIYSMAIPLVVKVVTELSGEKLVFSGLDIKVSGVGDDEEEKIQYKDSGAFAEILSPVTGECKYLLRLKLLCGHEMERRLQNSRISLKFHITLIDDHGKDYRCKFYIKIQNVDGKSNILSVLPKRRCF